MSSNGSFHEPTPLIPLIDYLDDKVSRWWEKPEVVKALLTDRTYHLTHLELVRVGTLSVTMENAFNSIVYYKQGPISVFKFYQDKFDIELKNPQMPLFTCDDGELTMYPAEVIALEIVPSVAPHLVSFVGHSCRTTPITQFLTEKVGSDWIHKPEEVNSILNGIDFHLQRLDPPEYGSLTLSKRTPQSTWEFPSGKMTYSKFFASTHNYEIKDLSTPLFTVNRMNSKKFHWPAELISIVLY